MEAGPPRRQQAEACWQLGHGGVQAPGRAAARPYARPSRSHQRSMAQTACNRLDMPSRMSSPSPAGQAWSPSGPAAAPGPHNAGKERRKEVSKLVQQAGPPPAVARRTAEQLVQQPHQQLHRTGALASRRAALQHSDSNRGLRPGSEVAAICRPRRADGRLSSCRGSRHAHLCGSYHTADGTQQGAQDVRHRS